jgi:hypothetical protein
MRLFVYLFDKRPHMKKWIFISFFSINSIGMALSFEALSLLDSFRANPVYILKSFSNFNTIKVQSIGSEYQLLIYHKDMGTYELTYSELSMNYSKTAYSLAIKPKINLLAIRLWSEHSKSHSHYYYPDSDDETYIFEEVIYIDTLKSLTEAYNYGILGNDSLVMKYSYMLSPFCGLDYGRITGWHGQDLKINSLFHGMIQDVPPNEFYILLCSLNPYVRIMAADYYFNNKSKFKPYKDHLIPLLSSVINNDDKLLHHWGGCFSGGMYFTAKSWFKRYNKRGRLSPKN